MQIVPPLAPSARATGTNAMSIPSIDPSTARTLGRTYGRDLLRQLERMEYAEANVERERLRGILDILDTMEAAP